MTLGFKVKVNRNHGRAAAEAAAYPPRLDAAMRRGTERGTKLLGTAVEALVEDRTSMGRAVAQRITKAEMVPGVGPVSRGRVSFADPPSRFYPKKGKALAFTIGGRKIVVRSVRGSRPYALIGRAAEAESTAKTIEAGYREEIGDVL